MNEITPVLLAGGSGTRLWPLSREAYPKQFLKIIGDKSLFQESALRLTSSKKIKFKPHLTLTTSEYSTWSPIIKLESPEDVISTFLSICLRIHSICLSLISTP